MGKHANKLLYPSYDIGEYSIGADLVKDNPDAEYTHRGIEHLRKHALKLCRTENPDEIVKLDTINSIFVHNDKRLASYTLGKTLDKPLNDNIVGWVGTSSNRDAEALCRWSLQRTNDLTRSLHRDSADLVGHTLSKTEQLVHSGMFPRIALPVVEAATTRYRVQGMDAFHSGGYQQIAFCSESVIGMSNLYHERLAITHPSSLMLRTMFHEYLHGAGSDRGFYWGLHTRLPALRILEEAYVEHASTVAHAAPFFRRPHIIHPKKRPKHFQPPSNVYVPERTFLAEICNQAEVAVEELGVAFFSPRGSEVGERVRYDIERKIGSLFGSRESFFEFAAAYEAAEPMKRKILTYDTINWFTAAANKRGETYDNYQN